MPMFVFAASVGADARSLQAMLDGGADIDAAYPEDGQTALMAAAGNQQSSCVRFLLAHHANTAVKDRNGHTALYYAMNPVGEDISSASEKQVIHLLRQARAP